MLSDLRELWRYRELLQIFVQRDLKVRYKNSALGFGWSLLNPLMQVFTLSFVILFLMKQEDRPQNYHMYVFCATLPWLFFNTTLLDSASSLLNYHQLMRRTYFPRELVPLASVAANLVHFGLATGVFILYAFVNSIVNWIVGGSFNLSLLPTVLLLPLPMLGLAMLVTGLSMFLSVWTLYFEDVKYIADSALKILYWLVPVIYWAEMILRRDLGGWNREIYVLYMLNPLAAFITAFRKLALVPTKMLGTNTVTPHMTAAEWAFLAIGLLSSAAILALGYRYFCSRKWHLAERG